MGILETILKESSSRDYPGCAATLDTDLLPFSLSELADWHIQEAASARCLCHLGRQRPYQSAELQAEDLQWGRWHSHL